MESKRFFFLAHLSYVGGETSTFFGRFTLKKNGNDSQVDDMRYIVFFSCVGKE